MLNSDFTELYWYSLNVYIFPENSSNQSCAFTVWKLRKFSLTLFWQNFRESNVFTKENTKELISRNFFSVRENFSFFHTVALLQDSFNWFRFHEKFVKAKQRFGRIIFIGNFNFTKFHSKWKFLLSATECLDENSVKLKSVTYQQRIDLTEKAKCKCFHEKTKYVLGKIQNRFELSHLW